MAEVYHFRFDLALVKEKDRKKGQVIPGAITFPAFLIMDRIYIRVTDYFLMELHDFIFKEFQLTPFSITTSLTIE